MALPIQGVAYTTQDGFVLVDKITGAIIDDPSIAEGDFKISKDKGAFANLVTLPAVSPTGSPAVYAVYSAAEMTANTITIWGVDQAGVWDDVFLSFEVPTASVEDVTISPTSMNKIADHVIKRSMASARASSDGDDVTGGRNMLGMLSKVKNKVSANVNPNTLTTFEENDTTVFFEEALTTDADAKTITSVDPT